MNTYANVANDAPMFTKLQYRNLPLKAFDVIRILIGPAIGMEQTNPVNKPTIDMVIILSNMNIYCFDIITYELSIGCGMIQSIMARKLKKPIVIQK
jgi:hypothetical protein